MICEAAAEQNAASICELLAQLGERLGDNQKVGDHQIMICRLLANRVRSGSKDRKRNFGG